MATATKMRPKAIPEDSAPAPVRVIRDADFAKRLESAYEGNPHCPEKHRGRQTWVQRELESRFGEKVSAETVRKWFYGETKPRPDKIKLLAELLQVDVAWLQIGIDPDMTPRERKVRNAMADGAVNLVAGLIQMDGGHPAFPEETDKAAQRNNVDIHAIIRGAKYDFHVAIADEEGRFFVPTNHENVIVLGLVRDGFNISIYEVSGDMIEEFGHRRGGSIEVTAPLKKLRRIESFANRI